MLTFTEIEQVVDDQLTTLAAQPDISNALRAYRLHGGDEAVHPWRVAGFYAYEGKNKRLVFESLYLKSLNTCIIRVFRENQMKILYARKVTGDATRLALVAFEAGGLFLLHLHNALPVQAVERDYNRLSELTSQSISRALFPIPPPVNLADIES